MEILFKKSDIKRVIFCPKVVKVKTTFLGYRFEDIQEESKVIIVLNDNHCYRLDGNEETLRESFKSIVNNQLRQDEEYILIDGLIPYEYYHHK